LLSFSIIVVGLVESVSGIIGLTGRLVLVRPFWQARRDIQPEHLDVIHTGTSVIIRIAK
jgi:hypothetical protein